jgi:hypothetical protein
VVVESVLSRFSKGSVGFFLWSRFRGGDDGGLGRECGFVCG